MKITAHCPVCLNQSRTIVARGRLHFAAHGKPRCEATGWLVEVEDLVEERRSA